MNAVETTVNRVDQDREPAAELSAEEQAVLARIRKQAKTQRPRLGQWLKSPPLCFVLPY